MRREAKMVTSAPSVSSDRTSLSPGTRPSSEAEEGHLTTTADSITLRQDARESPKLGRFVTVALATETLLVCIEGASPVPTFFLPVGGTHLAQLGFVLGLAVVATHLSSVVQRS